MIVNRYQVNLSTIASGTTDINITLPFGLESQGIGQSELIQSKFVDVQTELAINPILDYEKVRFLPVNTSGDHINNITYNINLTGSTHYGQIGFTNDDIKYERNNFLESFLYLTFFDSDNAMTQRLVTYMTLFAELDPNRDLLPSNDVQIATFGSIIGLAGQPKPAGMIPLNFTVSSPIFNPRGFNEGYHLYDYKDELNIGQSKYLYMKGSFKNAKTGKSTGLMVKNPPTPFPIDVVVHEVYTRFKLFRTQTGYYYQIDDTYGGVGTPPTNNVTISPNNNISINLYQIQAS